MCSRRYEKAGAKANLRGRRRAKVLPRRAKIPPQRGRTAGIFYLCSQKKHCYGTGETPSNRRFYEACGFRFTHRIPDFFRENYDRPIVDEGIVLRDMIRFRKERAEVVIETERLRLRPWRETDAETLYRYAQDPAVGPMAGWAPHRSVEESRAIIRTVFSAPEVYAAALRESDEPVGAIGLHFAETVHTAEIGGREAEIGYWIGRPFWGRGLIPEAVRAMQRRAFEELGLQALWCGWYDGNDRSRRVQEKCGFRYHHTEYDKPTLLGDRRTEHFSRLTRAEWKEMQLADLRKDNPLRPQSQGSPTAAGGR